MRTQSSTIISHFSHPHPLHLTNPKLPSHDHICSACNQTLETEPLYTCISPSCSCTTYSLHLKCSQLPQTITHPCHNHHNHPLSLQLLPISQNPSFTFTCNACGKQSDCGFLYNCKDCGINIHVACANLPLGLSHRSHCHQLSLVFSTPYNNNEFSCDVCGKVDGSRCWLYRCEPCVFDAHLLCVTSSKAQVVDGAAGKSNEKLLLDQVNNERERLQVLMARYDRSGVFNMNKNNQTLVQGGRSNDDFGKLLLDQVNNQRDQILQAQMVGVNMNNQLLQAMMSAAAAGGSNMNNQILQATMGAGAGGGGNNINNQLLQAMMGAAGGGNMNNQMFQAMMGASGSGGNMNNQMFQAMMGASGSGGNMNNQMLQGIMGATGGGGSGDGSSQLLQAIMGGGGGSNGVDLSSVLGLMGAGFGGFGF